MGLTGGRKLGSHFLLTEAQNSSAWQAAQARDRIIQTCCFRAVLASKGNQGIHSAHSSGSFRMAGSSSPRPRCPPSSSSQTETTSLSHVSLKKAQGHRLVGNDLVGLGCLPGLCPSNPSCCLHTKTSLASHSLPVTLLLLQLCSTLGPSPRPM